MKSKSYHLLPVVFFFVAFSTFSQRGKNLDVTINTTATVVNTYTNLTADAIDASSVTVANAAMTGGAFGAVALAAGDLVLIIQMQGTRMNIGLANAPNFTTSFENEYNGLWPFDPENWGEVYQINNAGKFEMAEVRSVAGNTINFQCALVEDYTATGKVQVVRIPRYNNLTLDPNAEIIPTTWNGTTGGIVAIEVAGNLVLGANSRINASAYGFRGGLVSNNVGLGQNGTPSTYGAGLGDSFLGSANIIYGGAKGEGIGGFTTEYSALSSVYGRGAPANGGGGGGHQNAGGGGGANVGSGTYTGKGVPNPTYNNAWDNELITMPNSVSSGGGRGGYTLSTSNQDATAVGPNNALWGGDVRRINGGLGGHALDYDATRLFMGGGGGAGHSDSGSGGSGGNGGGIVMLTVYGTISGTGRIETDGAVGLNTNPGNSSTSQIPSTNNKKGNDGAGGGGGGGAVYIKNSSAIPATITINARGANGGNHNLKVGLGASSEASGPGGAGAGGSIAITSGTPVRVVTGGSAGISTATAGEFLAPTPTNHVAEMVVNGATNGASGLGSLATTIYNITATPQTICGGNTATLTAATTGTVPGTLTWYSQQFGGSSIGTGTTYTTPVLNTTTTYYVGICPGTFRVPVTVTVNPAPIISGTAVITNAGCTTPGSITGLSASGGTGALTYSWNGSVTPSGALNNVSAGSYTLTVSDASGCSVQSGPYTISGTSGPIVNTTNVALTNQSCNGTMGSITGITATGTGLTYSWAPSGGSALNASNLAAGSYTLTVTDNVGCTATAGPYTINFIAGPTVNATNAVVTNENCNQANGSITGITATGTSLSYSWSNGGGSNLSASGLGDGSYSLTVTDGIGCTASAGPFTVTDLAGPTINASGIVINNVQCNGTPGSITGITASGGTGVLTYDWNGTASPSADLASGIEGTYTLTVFDAAGCSVQSGPHTIAGNAGPSVNVTAVVLVDQNCNGTMGSISGITATGSGLTYSWLPSGGSNLNASNLIAGTYGLTVTDNVGCVATAGPFTIGFVAGPTVNATNVVLTDENCGQANGSITGITATGTGLGYTWTNSGGTALNPTGLSAGNYSLTVLDGNGCSASAGPFTINNIAGPSISIANVVVEDEHCGQSDGSISGITVSGGAPAYTITWTNTTQTTLDITNLAAGNYALLVEDQDGCTVSAGPYTVVNLAAPVINASALVLTNPACNGTLGSITGLTASGENPVTIDWANGAGANIGSTLNATGLAADNYTLTVSDPYGCSTTSGPHTLTAPNYIAIDITGMVVTPTSCTANTGSISGITYTGGTNPTVSWSNGPSTLNMTNLGAGQYTLTVSDAQGCSDQVVVDLTMQNAPIIDITAITIVSAHCGQDNGSISGITVSGGTPTYAYSWNGNSAINQLNLSNENSGNYVLEVTDSEGCSDTETIAIPEIPGPTISAAGLTLLQPTCTIPGAISGLTVTGEAPYQYSWTGTNQTTLDITNVVEGSYSLTVTDNFGCTSTYGPVTLTEPAGPTAAFTWTPGSPDVGVLVTFNNGSTGNGPLTYTWTIDGQTVTTEDPTYIFTAEGDYPVTLIVVDAAGCDDEVTKVIGIYGELVIPNVITANADGQNDLFEIEGLKPETTLLIFNRWGNVVFESDNYLNDWNGTDANGLELAAGVYTYLLQPKEEDPQHGFIHLVR